MLTLTSLEIGTPLTPKTWTLHVPKTGMSSNTPTVRSPGNRNFNVRLPYPVQNWNKLAYPMRFGRSSPLSTSSRKSRTFSPKRTAAQNYLSMSSKIMWAPSKWQPCTNIDRKQSNSTFDCTNFKNMYLL